MNVGNSRMHKMFQILMVITVHAFWHIFHSNMCARNERGYFKTSHRVGFFENFSLFLTYNRIGVPYGHDFFTGAKNQSSRTLQIPRTQSLSIQKNFQRPSKKKFHLKNSSFIRIFQSKSELQISKSKLFSLFLAYNRIGAPYSHDFFTGVKNYFGWTFQIP